MGYITEEGLKNLKAYKYVSGGYSFMDNIFNHWWEFFVKLIPLVRCCHFEGCLDDSTESDYSGRFNDQYRGYFDLYEL